MTRIVLDVLSNEREFSEELLRFLSLKENVSYFIEGRKAESYQCEDYLKLMYFLGMPMHLKGTAYLAAAAAMLSTNPEFQGLLTKEIYPGIAKKYGTSAEGVERSIRNAISIFWKKGGEEEIAGAKVLKTLKKPTNSEFLSFLSMRILKEWVYLF